MTAEEQAAVDLLSKRGVVVILARGENYADVHPHLVAEDALHRSLWESWEALVPTEWMESKE